MKHNKYWFKPKWYGYGAYPSTWEGILLMVGYILVLFFLMFMFVDSMNGIFLVLAVPVTICLVYVSAKKTDGKWKWRWGK